MDLGIRGRVALVGGASRGLGRAVAEALADAGCRLAICARGQGGLQEAAEALSRKTEVLAVPTDLSKKADVEKLVGAVLERYGHVDILVNNAGGPPPGGFFDMTDEHWYAAFDLTFMSAWRLTRAFIDGMRERKWGRIINLTSISVKEPIDHLILSNAIRLALVGMAKTLAREVAADGITVNNIATGLHATERMQALIEDRARREGRPVDEVATTWIGAIPAGRMGNPRELADLVAFLASERAAFITGTTIQIDGGQIRFVL